MDFLSSASAYEAGLAVGKILVVVLVTGMTFGGGLLFIVSLIKAIRLKTIGWILCCVISGVFCSFGLFGSLGMATRAAVGWVERYDPAFTLKKRLESEDKRISIEVPELWKSTGRRHESSVIEATDLLEQTCVMVLVDAKEDFLGTLEEFDDLTVEGMKNALDEPSISGPENRLIGGLPAIYRRIAGTTDLTRIVYHRVSIESSECYYQVLAWTSPSREAKMFPLLMAILESSEVGVGIPVDLEPVPPELDVLSRVMSLVVGQLGANAASIRSDSRFEEDFRADEQEVMRLLKVTGKTFGITIPDADAKRLKTVGDLAGWLERHSSEWRH
jgi:acyl carrier protein